MKSIKQMTDQQVTELAKLGMKDLINQDNFFSMIKGQRGLEYKLKINRELFDVKKNLIVIRAYLDGFADATYLQIWEGEPEYDVDVDLVQDSEDAALANTVKIVKKLVEWGYA